MDPGRDRWWEPDYTTDAGSLVSIRGVSSSECPVSICSMDPDLIRLVDEVVTARLVREETGAVWPTPNPEEWEGLYADAVRVLAVERAKVDNARSRVEQEELRRG